MRQPAVSYIDRRDRGGALTFVSLFLANGKRPIRLWLMQRRIYTYKKGNVGAIAGQEGVAYKN